MSVRKLLGLVVVSWVAASPVSWAEETCADCKSAALAQQSRCQALAAPDPGLRAKCDSTFAEAMRGCQESACKVEVESMAAAQCGDCLKQADAEMKKCVPLPAPVRGACEARAASLKKACDDKLCPVLKVK